MGDPWIPSTERMPRPEECMGMPLLVARRRARARGGPLITEIGYYAPTGRRCFRKVDKMNGRAVLAKGGDYFYPPGWRINGNLVPNEEVAYWRHLPNPPSIRDANQTYKEEA